MDAVVPLPSARLLVLIGVLSAPLLVLVCLTHDAAAHQAALTGVALIATVVAADGCRRARNPAQYALFAGIALWTTGSAIATLELFSGAYTSYPTVAEAFWLASYPAFWVALMLMVPRWGLGHWIDGIVACLGTAAVASAILMPGLAVSGLSALGQDVASAFAIGDFLLLGFTGAALIVTRRWRVAQWRRLTVGIILLAGTDLLFASRLAGDATAFASPIDCGWVLGLTALAVVRPSLPRREPAAARRPIGSAVCTVAALCVIVIDHYHRVADGPLWLAVATLLLGVMRTVDSARLAEAERLAMTDELTRVGNRRRLFRDLGAALERGEALRLALFDLNGFKAHNDTFGHVSGDELLASLGARLNSAVEGAGGAYRLGGDEFCVLLSADVEGAFERAHAALHDDGISASSGSVLLPVEARDPTQALRIADARMYADKLGAT